jgi:hypothetical protein
VPALLLRPVGLQPHPQGRVEAEVLLAELPLGPELLRQSI